MKIGVVFPQTEIGNDPVIIRDFAQAVEGMGFNHLLVYDHVLGADRDRPGGFEGPYDKDTAFHEPFVLFGYLAGMTQTIELVTGVIILPQRQVALVAKQAAEVAVLSGGRLRLGIGVGWNAVEYEALGESFSNRGQREEEQVQVLRALWENETIDFEGRWHRVPASTRARRPRSQFGLAAPRTRSSNARRASAMAGYPWSRTAISPRRRSRRSIAISTRPGAIQRASASNPRRASRAAIPSAGASTPRVGASSARHTFPS